MTTTAQVRELIGPLLERHSDLAMVGRWIFVTPVHHFARGILLDRLVDREKVRPRWAVTHLFQIRRFFPLDFGEMLYNERSPRPGSWRVNDPDVSSALIEQIEERVLPTLRAMETLDDYLSFVSGHHFRHKLFDWPDVRIVVEVALGNLSIARLIREENIKSWSESRPGRDKDAEEMYRALRDLCALLASDDRAGLAKVLHQWEAFTAKNLELESLWEPTPFPLELQATRL